MEKSKWKTPQSFVVIAIIVVIFAYIAVDALVSKPQIKNDLKEVKGQYVELSTFLDEKIPEIDSTFREHAGQIQQQKSQITVLQETLGELNEEE
jgi:hypothetical protein